MHRERPGEGRDWLWILVLAWTGLMGGCMQAAAGPVERATVSVEMDAAVPVVDTPDLRIHYVPTGMSNAYLLETPDGVVLVDTGLSSAAETVLARLEELGRADLCLIYITHAHLDHYGAAAELRRATGAPVAVHAGDAQAMAEGQTQLGQVRDWEWTEGSLPLVEEFLEGEPTEPDRIVENGARLDECGLQAEVVHTPGHTPGSSILVVDGRYAFVGDLLSTNGEPHVQRFYAHDWRQIAGSLETLRDLQPVLVFPGHGETMITGEMLDALEPEIIE